MGESTMQICLDGRMSADGSVVALGMFDGVHIGHRVLLDKARAVAEQHHLPMVVHTFAQHPLSLVAPEKQPPLLTTLEERAALIAMAGADVFSAVAFTQAVRDMAPEAFIGRLVQQWKPKAIVVGFNYHFGHNGEGTPQMLVALGRALGFQTYVVPAIRISGRPVSASLIRGMLLAGKPEQARVLLGRAYSTAVNTHKGRATQWVLTLRDADKLQMPIGVYRVILTSGEHKYPALVRVNSEGLMRCATVTPCMLQDTAVVSFVSAQPGD